MNIRVNNCISVHIREVMFFMFMLRIKDKDELSETIIRILIEVEGRVRDCLSEFI